MSTVFAFHHSKGFQVENTKYFSSITGYLYCLALSPVVEAVGLGAASAERDKRRLLTLEKNIQWLFTAPTIGKGLKAFSFHKQKNKAVFLSHFLQEELHFKLEWNKWGHPLIYVMIHEYIWNLDKYMNVLTL